MAPRITHTSSPRASTNPHQRFARARAYHLASGGYPVEDFQRHWNEQMGLTSATQLIYWMAGYEISKPSQAMADEVNQCLTPLFSLNLRRRPPQSKVPPLDEDKFRPHVVFFWEVLHQYSQMLQSKRSLESVFGLLEWYRRYGLVQENGVVGLREMMWLRADWERGAVLVDALRGLRVPMIAVSQKDWLVYVPRDEAEMCRMLWETLPHQDQAKLKPHLKRRRNGGKKSRKWWA